MICCCMLMIMMVIALYSQSVYIKGKVKSIHLRYGNIYDDNDNVINNYFRYNDNDDENDDNDEHQDYE